MPLVGPPGLPVDIDAARFDALHDEPGAWRAVMESLALEQGTPASAVKQETEGTVLVARLGRERVLKLYPPFLRDHFEFERAMLARLHRRLRVPTPELLASGERDGWPYLVMTQMAGEPLTTTWPAMSETERCALLHELGALAAEVHALPVGEVAALAPRWEDFVTRQRERCVWRQQRTGLPAHLLAQVPAFVDGPLPEGPAVLLTGEYTPFNLFTTPSPAGHRLSAMFDFGDGLVGPREYDWLGPQCFLVAGDRARSEAFMHGYGARVDEDMRLRLMRLLLLHRYSHLKAQVAIEGWQELRSFEELAARLWPLP
ncbi:MAG: aminoglycoside 3'-phosphotransferase/choline kinase family protein [Rubrivivax sp.]|nr:aminoglycoside 3'-phosphotransferase/choline kinase family protein [Rubrivivax sp.]